MDLLFTFTCQYPQSLKEFHPLIPRYSEQYWQILKNQPLQLVTEFFLHCHSKPWPWFLNTDIWNSQTAATCLCVEADFRGNRPEPWNLFPENKNNDGWSTFHSETQNNFYLLLPYAKYTPFQHVCQHHSFIICSHIVLSQNVKVEHPIIRVAIIGLV